jgi:hypothetical protein
MLPGISAEDCLFADLGIDPAASGCQSFEATDFLIRPRTFDTSVSLILWQIGVVGEMGYKSRISLNGLRILVDALQHHYDPAHEVVIYEAAVYPHCDPFVKHLNLARLPESGISPVTTLYVPPKARALLDLDMVDRLGIPRSYFRKRGRKPAARSRLRSGDPEAD